MMAASGALSVLPMPPSNLGRVCTDEESPHHNPLRRVVLVYRGSETQAGAGGFSAE
jgi:hypothetical protein